MVDFGSFRGEIIPGRTLFTQEDVMMAMEHCDFRKGIGQDWFNGEILKKSPFVREIVGNELLFWLNSGCTPEYVSEGRMVLFSKTKK